MPLGARATLVVPEAGEEGPPRLIFDGWGEDPPAVAV